MPALALLSPFRAHVLEAKKEGRSAKTKARKYAKTSNTKEKA
jgi:hypothetical protein